MAKSSRSSVRKRNNQVLRKTIFGPASDARTERLSAKLQELAAKPQPESEKAMDIDEDVDAGGKEADANTTQNADIDTVGSTVSRKTAKKRESARIEKKMSRRKPRNRVVFAASAAKQKRIAQSKKRGV